MTAAEATAASRQLLDALRKFLREEGWPVAFEDDEELSTAVAVEAESGRWLCVAQVLDDRPLVVFSSVLPTFVPPERRASVGEFLHRANAGLLLGGFQFDWDEGEIRYVTSLDLTGSDLSASRLSQDIDACFRQIVYANVSTVDQYLPALLTVVFAHADPAGAVAQAEQ